MMMKRTISKGRGNNNNAAFCALVLLWCCCCVGVARCEVGSVTPTPATHVLVSVKPVQESGGPQAFPNEEKANLPVFTMDYARVQVPFEFTLWILLASFAKIGFHVYNKITIWIPEPCLLISIGLVVGAIMHAVKEEPPAMLDSNVFFLYMLPLIVLENGYFMPTRAFFENVGTVVWYAVVGTLWNSVGIGLSLFAICQIEAFGVQDINLQENLLFASIIAAVDPVAALSVFEDVGVHEQLYIVIFGEGLFNDAVTVVLYNMFIFVADMPVVESPDVFLGVARFFVVGVGGVAFGFLFGFLAAFTTRFTNNVRQIEPLFVFLYSYLAYLVAELFAISSIMAIVVCAITMKYYVEENVAQRSCTTIRHVVKMLASISETLVFFFLGVVTITTEHEWNWAYILFTLLFAFVWRFLGVLVLTQIVNPFKTISFSYKDQFGLAYGGLRGAICFALAFTLPGNINRRELFVTASIAVIIFTVFIQGISLRPIIEYMNLRTTNKEEMSINMEIHNRMIEHTISGIEDLCGQWSHYYWKDKFKTFNDNVLRFILLRDRKSESSIVALYKKLELQSAIELLDTTVGDISAAPSLVNLRDEKKDKARSKKTFMAADIKKMHHILANNMYNIRQKTIAYSTRHNLPDNSKAREILIRRHASVRRSLRSGTSGSVRDSRAPSRSQKYYSLQPGGDLESAFPLRRLSSNGQDADQVDRRSERLRPGPSASAYSSSRSLAAPRRLDTLREGVPDPGGAEGKGGRKGPVPAPRRRLSDRSVGGGRGPGDETGGGDDAVRPPPLPPPISSGRVQADHREPMDNGAGDPLLRHPSSSSQGSRRSHHHRP